MANVGGDEGVGIGQEPQADKTASDQAQNTPTPTTTTAGNIPTPSSKRMREINEKPSAVSGKYWPAKKRPFVRTTDDHPNGKNRCPIYKARKSKSHHLISHFPTCVSMYGNPDALTWNELHQYKPGKSNINKTRRDKLISERDGTSAGLGSHQLQSHFPTSVKMFGNSDALTWNEWYDYEGKANVNKTRRDKLISERDAASAGRGFHQPQSHFQTCVNMYGNPDALTWNELHQYEPGTNSINKTSRDKLISERDSASAGDSTVETSADEDTTMTDAGDEVQTDDTEERKFTAIQTR